MSTDEMLIIKRGYDFFKVAFKSYGQVPQESPVQCGCGNRERDPGLYRVNIGCKYARKFRTLRYSPFAYGPRESIICQSVESIVL